MAYGNYSGSYGKGSKMGAKTPKKMDYVYSTRDKRRAVPLQKEEYSKHGVADMDKDYQNPSKHYTDGKTKDVSQPPPKKPAQKYGKKGGVTMTPGNKGFKVKSSSDLRKVRKSKYGY